MRSSCRCICEDHRSDTSSCLTCYGMHQCSRRRPTGRNKNHEKMVIEDKRCFFCFEFYDCLDGLNPALGHVWKPINLWDKLPPSGTRITCPRWKTNISPEKLLVGRWHFPLKWFLFRAAEPVVVSMALVVRVEEKAWHHERGRQQLPGCIFGDWANWWKAGLGQFCQVRFS